MKEPISEKAVVAINELNRVALIMARQMKSGELDKPTADKAIVSAQRKARVLHNAYFSRKHHFSLAASNEHLRQLTDFSQSGMWNEFKTANDRFNKVLKHYAKAVGAEFQTNQIYAASKRNESVRYAIKRNVLGRMSENSQAALSNAADGGGMRTKD